MKNFCSKSKKKFLSFIIAFGVLAGIVSPMQVLAAENDTGAEMGATLIKEDDSNYQEAIRVLGLSEEEASECNLYSIEPRGVSVPNNQDYWFNWFTFTTSNGGSYWTNNGSQLKWGYDWYGTYTNDHDLRLGVYLYKYPGNAGDLIDQMWAQNGESRRSGWLSVTRGLDYRFTYYCNYLTQSGTGTATVHMYVATRN